MDPIQLDTLFRESQQVVSENLIERKIAPSNAYYGKLNDGGQFPLHSGTRIQGVKLGAIYLPQDQTNGWRPIQDEICNTNACDFDPEIVSHGSDSFYFSLVAFDVRTDWICLASQAFRMMPAEEMAHMQSGLANVNRQVHEEFRRSRYISMGRNKVIYLVDEASEGVAAEDYWSCVDASVQNGFVFESRPTGEIDENHIRVCVRPDQIHLISDFTLDMADEARAKLVYDSDDKPVAGVLFDIILADQKGLKKLQKLENELTGMAGSYGGVSFIDLSQNFGTEGILRDYSIRTDIYAMRFFPDTAINAALAPEDFDANDPNTWPRFVRVHPYYMAKAEIGVTAVPNPNYAKAPFGITVLRDNGVIDIMSFPPVASIGSATTFGGLGFDGTAQWQNPDWRENINREKGFWKMRFRLSARPNRDERGYSWFHRIGNKQRLSGVACALPNLIAHDTVTPYCFSNLGATVDSGTGANPGFSNGSLTGGE